MKIENQKFVVTGIKRFKGEVEGQQYDYTKVYIETDMNDNENSRGTASAEYRVGDSSVFEKLAGIVLPAEVECDLNIVTNGKRVDHRMTIKRVINQKKAA